MADANNLGSNDTIPFAAATATPAALNLVNPTTILSGTLQGTQNVGGTGSPQIDSANNRITLSGTGSSTGTTNITLGNQSSGSSAFGINITDSFNDSISIGINSTGQVELLYSNGNVNQFLIGPDSTGNNVIKASPPGVEVTTASESQLSFDSRRSFTVLLQNSYTFPSFGSVPSDTLNGGSFVTIPHNAGFIPNVACFGQFALPGVTYVTAPTGFPLSSLTQIISGTAITQSTTLNGDGFFNFFYSFDTTNLYIGVTFQNGTNASITTPPLTIYYTVYALEATATT